MVGNWLGWIGQDTCGIPPRGVSWVLAAEIIIFVKLGSLLNATFIILILIILDEYFSHNDTNKCVPEYFVMLF